MHPRDDESPVVIPHEAHPVLSEADLPETQHQARNSPDGHGDDRLRAQPHPSWSGWVQEALSVESFWFGLLALALAWRGQTILTPGGDSVLSPDFGSAKRWYLIAIGVMFYGWWNSYTNHSVLVSARDAGWHLGARLKLRINRIRLGIVILSLCTTALAVHILYDDWYSFIGGWLWALSLLLLVLACLREHSVSEPLDAEKEVIAATSRVRLPLEALVIAAILVLAFVIRIWRIADLSPGMHGDEGEAGTIGLDILNGVTTSPFLRGWFNQSNIYFWCVALFMKIFGTGIVGLRSWAVFCGLVTVVFVYLITREMFGLRAAIMAGFLIAFQSADVLESRQLSINAATAALSVMAFFFLIRGLRTKKHGDFVLSGLSAGFNLYFYAGGRLIGPMLVLGFLYLSVTHRTFLRRYWTRAVAFGISALVMAAPFLALNRKYPLPSNSYPNDRWIWLHHADLATLYGTSDWRLIVWEQLQRTLSVFTWNADYSANHILDYPIARPAESIVLILGLAWAVWRWQDTRFALITIWFWTTIIVGGALTTDAPNVHRLVELLPVLPIIIAAWLDHFGRQFQLALYKVATRAWMPIAPWISSTALGGLVLVAGLQNWDKYINYYLHTHTQPDVTEQAIYVQHHGMRYRYYGMGAPVIYFNHGDNRFINHGADGIDAVNPSNLLPITDNGLKGNKDVTFLVWFDMFDYLPVLHAYYPGGKEQSRAFGNPQDHSHLITYDVSNAEIERHRAVQARYESKDGTVTQRMEGGIGNGHAPPSGLQYPARATWAGGLVAPTYGLYTFSVSAPTSAQVDLDGSRVLTVHAPGESAQVSLSLAQGVHSIRLHGTLADARTHVELQWTAPGYRMSGIPRRYLWDNHVGSSWFGKIVSASRPADILGRRLDGFLGFRQSNAGIGDGFPFRASWASILHARTTGPYTFELQSNGGSTLRVDGKTVVGNPGDGAPHSQSGTVQLSGGIHRLQIDYNWQLGFGDLELFWTPPGGTRQLMLSPLLTVPARAH